MSFFFHTDVENLKKLDSQEKNAFSVVLSNDTFRKAMSLAIDRSEFVTTTQAWTPAFSLMNHLYHYDIYNDPYSSYRNSEEAMKAIVNLYGVEYGEGKLYETLEEAHDSITGYNLTEAKALFTKACEELVAEGLYTAGSNIKIQIGWAKGALTPDDDAQCTIIEKQLNAALAGTGFGTIDLEPLGNIDNRYADTASGLYAIGYGAWGGAAFYPFRNMQVYTDPNQYSINEAGCWDPTTTMLTLTIEGEEVEMSWTDWGNCLIGTGKYANASNDVKLYITAQLEQRFLEFYYRIPLAVTTVCSLNSYKVEDYTDSYNIMYGFGGFRIMDYNYSDAEWDAYVESQGGELNYK
jgi:oligopeptide transport system substrate-binding protein